MNRYATREKKPNSEGINHSSSIHHLLEAQTARSRSNLAKLSLKRETFN